MWVLHCVIPPVVMCVSPRFGLQGSEHTLELVDRSHRTEQAHGLARSEVVIASLDLGQELLGQDLGDRSGRMFWRQHGDRSTQLIQLPAFLSITVVERTHSQDLALWMWSTCGWPRA